MKSRFVLPFLLALGLLLGGYALLRPAQAGPEAPLVLWVERIGGENQLRSAPADALDNSRLVASLPSGEVVDAALSPRGGRLALVLAGRGEETLWLVSLPKGESRRLESAPGFGALRWEGMALVWTVFLPEEQPVQGKGGAALIAAPRPERHWYAPSGQPPAPAPYLTARGDSLVWVDASGEPRPLERAQRGLSALWDAGRGLVLLSRLEEGRAILESLDPRTGERRILAHLPPAEWRLLAWEGDWAAAERYPRGVQIISLQRGEFRGLGGGRYFAGLLPPEMADSTSGGGWLPSMGDGRTAGDGGSSRPLIRKPVTTTTSTPVPSATPTLAPTKTPTPTATPTATPTPACDEPPQGCPVGRVYGHQPARWEMGGIFVGAAENTLGSAAPVYEGIFTGRPPVRRTVSPQQPLPHLTLRSIAWQEAAWLQFLHDGAPFDDVQACTIVSFDCGYGLMQVTSCMGGGCGWLDPSRAAAELPYNLGAGTNILIQKWNSVPYLGENDPTDPAQWYYAVLAYNGWSTLNDPNNTDRFDPRRPPFREGSGSYRYPYEERVYGWMAHPPSVSGHLLWRPTNIPAVPRGIFGLRAPDSWTPPSETTRPLTHLFHEVRVAPQEAPTLRVENTRPYTLALDILFYDAEGNFDRRYLPPSAEPPWFVEPYLRLAPSGTFTLPLQSVFFTETFTGYVRIYASEGLSITLMEPPPEKSFRAYLPLVQKAGGETPPQMAPVLTCTQVLTNGGFEAFSGGRPAGWGMASAGEYVLADSTWFRAGHFGGYLGGYASAADTLSQTFDAPLGGMTATLTLAWDVSGGAAGDVLTATLVDEAGLPIGAPWTVSGAEAPGGWQEAGIRWPLAGRVPAAVRFVARTGENGGAAFFVDNVQLEICGR